jgi:hypothetical protein
MRIIQTIRPSCTPDFTKRPAAYPVSSGFLSGPRCRYMKKPIAAPHRAPTPQKSRSSFPNFQAGAIIFLSCITSASELEILPRGRSKPVRNIPWGLWGCLKREITSIQYETLLRSPIPLHGTGDHLATQWPLTRQVLRRRQIFLNHSRLVPRLVERGSATSKRRCRSRRPELRTI